MKLLIGNTAITKAIASIQNRGRKLDADIHLAGVSCLAHINEHGDTTVLDKLVHALSKGTRKNAFVEWCLAFGEVRLLDKTNDADRAKIEQGMLFAKDKARTFNLDGAIGTMWTEFKPEPDVLTVFDLQGATAALIKRYTKAVQQGAEVQGSDVAVNELRKLLAQLEG